MKDYLLATLDKILGRKVTYEDKEIFSKQSDESLADAWSLLNSWEWPTYLPNEEGTGNYDCNGRRSQLMRYIESKLSYKYINRRWNKDRMTDEEHEIFWKDCLHNKEK